MYRVENTLIEHSNLLKLTLTDWGERQPDMYLISLEGVKVFTQRILLSFYSNIVCKALEDVKEDVAGINVSAKSSSLTMLLKVLVCGSVIAKTKKDLVEVGQAADSLGIMLNNTQIGYRKKNVNETAVNNDKSAGASVLNDQTSPDMASTSVKTEPMFGDFGESVNYKKSEKKKKRNSQIPLTTSVNGYTCQKCGKILYSAVKLKHHMNIHMEDKPFKCDVCEKGFSAPTSLKNHRLLHTGEVFKCEYCDYSAVQKGNLKYHRMKKHKSLIGNEEKSDVEEKSEDKMADSFDEKNILSSEVKPAENEGIESINET